MKQGKHYLSIVIWIFLAAIVAYFGYNLATSLYTPLTTTTAVEYEAGAGYYATGFVVRDESLFSDILVTIHEGRNRQVRRMFDSVGHKVLLLRRVRFGPLELGDLRRGEWRELSAEEIARLKAL